MEADIPIRMINQTAAQDIGSLCHAYRRLGIACRPDGQPSACEGRFDRRHGSAAADLAV